VDLQRALAVCFGALNEALVVHFGSFDPTGQSEPTINKTRAAQCCYSVDDSLIKLNVTPDTSPVNSACRLYCHGLDKAADNSQRRKTGIIAIYSDVYGSYN